ncbi:MAG: hypothetical protein K2G35_10865 [Duncaniella sp.]|nr:hypothetical protein [Duncaniella sp.]
MSRNRRLAEIFLPKGLPKGVRTCYVAIYAIVAVYSVAMIATAHIIVGYDTASYYAAIDNLLAGRPDLWRTPVYPLILALCRSGGQALGGGGEAWAVVQTAQWVVLFLAIPAFRLAAARVIGPHPKAVLLATAVFALHPALLSYPDRMLTESFSISFSAFFVASFLKGVTENRSASMWRAMGWLTVLVMLRPVFVCYLPVAAVAIVIYGVQCRHTCRRALRAAVAGFLLCVGVCAGYVAAMHRTYGIHSLTIVSSVNNYYLFWPKGMVVAESATSPEVAEAIRRNVKPPIGENYEDVCLAGWEDEMAFLREISPVSFESYINTMMKRHRDVVAEEAVARLTQKSWSYHLSSRDFVTKRLGFKLPAIFSIAAGLLFLTITSLCLAVLWIRRRRVNVGVFITTGLPLVLMISTLIGAQSDYHRLFIPALPLFYLLGIYCAQRVWTRFKLNQQLP